MAFRSPYDRVLWARAAREEMEKEQLLIIEGERELAARQVDEAEEGLRRRLARAARALTSPGELEEEYRHLAGLSALRQRRREALAAAEESVVRQRGRVLEAWRARRALEALRSRAEARWVKEQMRKEQQEVDDRSAGAAGRAEG